MNKIVFMDIFYELRNLKSGDQVEELLTSSPLSME